MIGELLSGFDPALLASPAVLLGLVWLLTILGWLVPKRTLDKVEKERDALQTTLDNQSESFADIKVALADLKVSSDLSLYALSEIQDALLKINERKAGDT